MKLQKNFRIAKAELMQKILSTQILHPEINLTTEKVNVPELPFRTLVTYKNFNTVYFRLIELTPQLKKDIARIIMIMTRYFKNLLIKKISKTGNRIYLQLMIIFLIQQK